MWNPFAGVMSEVHDDAATLPPLISVTDKHLPGAKNTAYKRWLDVSKREFWQDDVQNKHGNPIPFIFIIQRVEEKLFMS